MIVQSQKLNNTLKPHKINNLRGNSSPLNFQNNQTSPMPTFKGSFNSSKFVNGLKKVFVKDVDSIDISSDVVKRLDGIFDSQVTKLLDEVKNIPQDVKTSTKAKFIKDANGAIKSVEFEESPIAVRLLKKLVYPIYPGLVKDLPNAIIDKMQSTKHLNFKFLEDFKNTKFLSSGRTIHSANDTIDSLYGILNKEQVLKLKNVESKDALEKFYLKMFGGSRGNYSNQSERALNALATSAVSGVFSSNDFYNMSRYHNDDPNKAEKAKKDRFVYDIGRGILKAVACFTTAGALSKYTNSNKSAAIANLMLTTFVIETVSRLISKKPLLPITKKQAIEKYNELNKDVADAKQIKNTGTKSDANEKSDKKGGSIAKKVDMQEDKKGSALKGFLAIIGGIAFLGFGKAALMKCSKGSHKFLNNMSSSLNKVSDTLSVHDYKMDPETVNEMLKKLKSSERGNLAELFENSLKDANGNINYTVKTRGTWGRFLNPISAFLEIFKKPFALGEKAGKKLFNVTCDNEVAKAKTNEAAFEMYKKLTKKGGKGLADDFDNRIAKVVKNGFNINTSVLDTRELIRNYVFFNTLIPSYFFVNDYRNEELIQSKGENTPRVKQVTEKRIMHRIVNYFSNRVFIDAFIALTGDLFNKSLLAATLISATTELTNETTIRKIIGTPIGRKSKAEIEEFEKKQENNKFSKFMKNILGKKTIMEKARKNKK